MVQPRGRSEKMPIAIGSVQLEIEQARPMKHRSPAPARRAISGLFVANGFAFGVWSAHIVVFKQNYQLSNAQLTIPLFSAATAATGYAVFSLSMMTGCFIGDHLTMKLGATNPLRASGILVAAGFGFALLGTTYFAAMIGFLFAGFGLSNMVALIFGAAARRFPGGVGAAIAASASVGYLGFLVGPPVVGALSGVVGLRAALALVVVAGVAISFADGGDRVASAVQGLADR